MTEMAETHVELNQFPVPRVGPRHSTLGRPEFQLRRVLLYYILIYTINIEYRFSQPAANETRYTYMSSCTRSFRTVVVIDYCLMLGTGTRGYTMADPCREVNTAISPVRLSVGSVPTHVA